MESEPMLRIRDNRDEPADDEQELRSILGAFMRAVNEREEPPGMSEVIAAAWTIIGRAVKTIDCPGCRQVQLDVLKADLENLAIFIEGGGGNEHVH